jgi:uncharacterized repeat protein (TIGR01451 family)
MHNKHLKTAWAATMALCLLAGAMLAVMVQADGQATVPFVITSHDPPKHALGVPLTAPISATFNQMVNPGTVTNDTFVVHGNLGGLAGGVFSWPSGPAIAVLDPDRAFHAGEVLRVSATSDILSLNFPPSSLTRYGWQFTAGEVRERCVSGFTDIEAGLTGVADGSVAWGDYDNDGDLDILLTGWRSWRVSKLYRNDGPSGFSDIGAGLAAVSDSAVAWGDYDNDGDLDILLTGCSASGHVSKVYRNDGPSGFTDIGAGLPGLEGGSVAWGDYNNDGDLDILLTGICGSIDCAEIYRNDGASGFTDINAGLAGITEGSVAWGDYDKDGDLDVLLAGSGVSEVYRNDGTSGFTDIAAGLPGVGNASVAWGDYDNDGDLDILLTGYTPAPSCVSNLYRNDGTSGFTDIAAGLTGVRYGSVAWGDYDNDGDLDILLTGETLSGSRVTELYRNDGASGFAAVSGAGLTRVHHSSVAWGDYDNDGDLDILLSGSGPSGWVSKVYRNDDCLPSLAISKMVDNGNPQPGQAFTYTIVVSNHGDAQATGAVVSDTQSPEVTFAGPVTLDPPRAGTVGTPPIVVWDATIAAGASMTVTMPMAVTMYVAPGTVTNTATVTCTQVATPVEGAVVFAVADVSPTLGMVEPSSGGGPTGVTTYFTTTWMDNNGWADLKQCYFHIGDSPSIVGNVTLLYNAVKNKLWLRTDDGSAWIGGCAPGTDDTMENSQAKVYCGLTTAAGADGTLTVKWAIEFKDGYSDTKKLGLKCKDRSKARAKGQWKGTWKVE